MASFKSIVKSKFIFLTAGFVFIAVLLVIYVLSSWFVEPKAYNMMSYLYSVNKPAREDSVLIVIDDKSVARYRWPWKRELYGEIFSYLHKYTDAKFIAFDAILASLDTFNPQSDKKLFDSIKPINNLVVGFTPQVSAIDDEYYNSEFYPAFSEKFKVSVLDKTKHNLNSTFNSVMAMPDAYFQNVKNSGSVYIDKDKEDNYLRSSTQLVKVGNDYFPSLALKIYLKENNTNELILKDNALIVGQTGLKIPGRATSVGFSNNIKFYPIFSHANSAYSHKVYSAIDIIDSFRSIENGKKPIINPDEFKDKVVFVGANASATSIGLADRITTPVMDDHPGVDYQAVNYDNIKNGEFIRLTSISQDIFTIALFSMIVFALIYGFSFGISLTLIILLCTGYFFMVAQCYKHNISMTLITPMLSALWTMVYGYSYRFIVEGKNKEKIKNAMGRYLSQDIMQNVVKHIDDIKLGGKKANVTVLFADIRGFTSMSEKMTAEDVSIILNEYFTEIEPIITKYNGVINKFIGDAVMAIFGEPIQNINHPENAVRCAYEMLEKVAELRSKWVKEGKPEIEIGIGINTGEAFVGNIGSEKRLEYTVIGDMVNLASRIESYNKVYKSNLLISSSTYECVSSIVEVVKISDVKIRGKAKKMDIYEVLKIC